MPSRRWLAVVLLAVVAAGCSREPHKSAQRRSQQEKTLWQTFMEEQSAAHPLKLAVPKAEDQAFGEEPRDIDQKDPRYWELSFGDHAVDPALFRERVTIFSRQYPGLVGFDEARTNVANDLYLDFLT